MNTKLLALLSGLAFSSAALAISVAQEARQLIANGDAGIESSCTSKVCNSRCSTNSARVSFGQKYESELSSETVNKTLVLQNVAGTWLIVHEQNS